MSEKIVFITGANGPAVWTRTRVRALQPSLDALTPGRKSDEAFLEKLIAEHPELLGIGDVRDESDIEGPFVAFAQIGLTALNGRTVYPDLVILWQSGHVVVVEVKLIDNTELRDRQVVAQLLEYSACLAQCSEQKLADLFGANRNASTWSGLIADLFPGSSNPTRLARRFLDKFRSAKLHLAIACDEAPLGLAELVKGVVGQSALGEYTFRVVEVMPYVSANPADGIAFLPRTLLRTEIVGRIAVTVQSEHGTSAPSVRVDVTSLDDQEEAVRSVRGGTGLKRTSTEETFFQSAEENGLAALTLAALREIFVGAQDRGWEFRWSQPKLSSREESFNIIIPSVSGSAIVSFFNDGQMEANFGNVPTDIAADCRTFLDGLSGVALTKGEQHARVRPETAWVPHRGSILSKLDMYASRALET